MKKVLLLSSAAAVFILALAGGAYCYFRPSKNTRPTPLAGIESKPLQAEVASGGRPAMPLPADIIVLTVADGAEVLAPFILHDESGAVGGIAAFQPKGTRTDEHPGKVKFTAKVREAGEYTAWLHAKWRDTCSNSCRMGVAGGPDFLVGEDDVFNVWHWVPASKHDLVSGDNSIVVTEREDGIFFDQVVFTKDATYAPTGSITTAGVLREIRRFADTFSRSPGHGNEGWEFNGKGKFDIAFSFDPNRIPNQYALSGDAKDGPCYALLQGAPWYGCKISFSFMPTSEGRYGCIMEKGDDDNGLSAVFEFKHTGAEYSLSSASAASANSAPSSPVALGDRMRLNQWHRVVIERWAWITRVWLDGKEVQTTHFPKPKAGKAGLFVESGTAVFDDFEIEEIPWVADDNAEFKIDWKIGDDAKWFRTKYKAGQIMTGESGSISAGSGSLPLNEIVVSEALIGSEDGYTESTRVATLPTINASALVEEPNQQSPGVHIYRVPELVESSGTQAVFEHVGKRSGFRSVALRFGRRTPATFNIGPYTFSAREMDDPSDYLDFTEEEYRAMEKSPEARKLARQAKPKPIIGHGSEDDEGPWTFISGEWLVDVREGCLKGRERRGAVAWLRHAQEISSDMEMRFKVRLANAASSAEVELYSGADPGLRVQLAPLSDKVDKVSKTDKVVPDPPAPTGAAMRLDIPADAKWHEITLRIEGSKLAAKLDRLPIQEAVFKRGDGDRIFLKVLKGAVDFDDVEFVVQRATDKGVLYAFNQPEPDWWREPAEKWIDHGGIACVLASNWISMIAPDSRATLWNKRAFSTNALVAFNVEENTDWHGWDKHPSHVHYPFDNIETTLASAGDPAIGYTLTVNAERHSATILFRNGKEVARVRQGENFPMRYIGSHMPFLPRTNRICLIKRGGLLRGIVNGQEVLAYRDPAPLEVSKVGIGGHNTRINFSHIEIVNLADDSQPVK